VNEHHISNRTVILKTIHYFVFLRLPHSPKSVGYPLNHIKFHIQGSIFLEVSSTMSGSESASSFHLIWNATEEKRSTRWT